MLNALTNARYWGQSALTVNLAGPWSSDLTKGTYPDGILAWIDKYCAKDPLKTLANATAELIIELRERKEHAQ
jgi:hypothetical protein